MNKGVGVENSKVLNKQGGQNKWGGVDFEE